jgi:putative transposase
VQAFRLAVDVAAWTVVVQAFRLAVIRPISCSVQVVITKRPRRLDGVLYVGYQRYFLTTCTAFRRPLFTNAALVSTVVEQLMDNAEHFELAILAYVLMPDHLHVLAEAESERSDFTAFVKRFKQITGFRHRQETGKPLWQHGYHERVLRDDEATEAVVRYILENPIRAGLSVKLGEYPFAGSSTYDLTALLTAWDGQT